MISKVIQNKDKEQNHSLVKGSFCGCLKSNRPNSFFCKAKVVPLTTFEEF